MDARGKGFKGFIHRLAVVALAALILVGLWEGYGAWLLKAVAHGG